MTKEKNIEEGLEIVQQNTKSLVLEGDPEAQLQYATKAANALMKVVNNKPKKVVINGKQYLEYGDWQTLARFFGSTAGIEWTKKLEENGKMVGYEARAIVYHNGQIISSAEASCMKSERNWQNRDEFAIKSMAQTRACAKALRNGFGWVAELAGYSATPAEEVDGVAPQPQRMNSYQVKRAVPAADDEAGGAVIQMEPDDNESKKTMIKTMLWNLGKRPRTPEGTMAAIRELTGVEAIVPENFDLIIVKLEALLKEDPVEKLADAIK